MRLSFATTTVVPSLNDILCFVPSEEWVQQSARAEEVYCLAQAARGTRKRYTVWKSLGGFLRVVQRMPQSGSSGPDPNQGASFTRSPLKEQMPSDQRGLIVGFGGDG